MLSKLKDFFNFNSTERNGILLMLLIIIIVAFIPRLYRHFSKPAETDFRGFQKDVEQFEASLVADSMVREKQFSNGKLKPGNNSQNEKVLLFPFDPNHTSKEQWKQLGLKDWQIRIIDNYLSKGGKFQKKEDFEKIYGLSRNQFESMEPFIQLPAVKEKITIAVSVQPQFHKKSIVVDINTADTSLLQELRGIGPAFAKRIVRYRDLLGGFYSPVQLLEVYGFDQQKYEMVAENCITGEGPFRKFNLNTTTTADLKKHPYLDYYIAKAIVDRRIAKGKYHSVEQLREIPLIADTLFQKLRHYLTVE
jgi:competence protein ComEA